MTCSSSGRFTNLAIENEWLVVRRRLLDILLNLLFDIPRTLDKQIDGIDDRVGRRLFRHIRLSSIVGLFLQPLKSLTHKIDALPATRG